MNNKRKIQENDIVLCTVKRIEGATIFLEIEENGEGSMTLSEVAPGRIRNLREYVVPNKKIVCKVLRIKNDHIELSLRRVSGGERDEVIQRYTKTQILTNMLKPVLKDKTKETLEKIKETYDPADFLDEARENPELIKKFVSAAHATELIKIFSEKREREKEVRETITITATGPDGLYAIQKTLASVKDKAEVHYKGSSVFSITVKAPDFKKANADMHGVIDTLEKEAKTHKALLKVKGK